MSASLSVAVRRSQRLPSDVRRNCRGRRAQARPPQRSRQKSRLLPAGYEVMSAEIASGNFGQLTNANAAPRHTARQPLNGAPGGGFGDVLAPQRLLVARPGTEFLAITDPLDTVVLQLNDLYRAAGEAVRSEYGHLRLRFGPSSNSCQHVPSINRVGCGLPVNYLWVSSRPFPCRDGVSPWGSRPVPGAEAWVRPRRYRHPQPPAWRPIRNPARPLECRSEADVLAREFPRQCARAGPRRSAAAGAWNPDPPSPPGPTDRCRPPAAPWAPGARYAPARAGYSDTTS